MASVAYLFSKVGSITFQPKDGVDTDAAWEAAIEVGAEDVELGEDGDVEVIISCFGGFFFSNTLFSHTYRSKVLTPPDTMQTVAEALEKHPSVASVREMSLIYRPITPFERSDSSEEEDEMDEATGKIVEALEDNPDTLAVYTTRG